MNPFAFQSLPDDARLWVLALDRPLEGPFREVFRSSVGDLLAHWHHKATDYHAAWWLLDEQILLVAEPSLTTDPSGCAIDGMTRKVAKAAGMVGRRLLEESELLFRVDGRLMIVGRASLDESIATGVLPVTATLLDRSLFDLRALRQGRLERPLAETWIGRRLPLATV